MIESREGWADRPVGGIWLVACIWFVAGVVMALLGVYLAALIR